MKAKKDLARRSKRASLNGPSTFEMEYLRQLKAELEAYLRGRGFSTIQEFQVGFSGAGYTGQMLVRA